MMGPVFIYFLFFISTGVIPCDSYRKFKEFNQIGIVSRIRK